MAQGNETPEEFPNVFFTVSDEGISSLQGLAARVWGHDPVEAPRPLSLLEV
jgi:hypothetical protein